MRTVRSSKVKKLVQEAVGHVKTHPLASNTWHSEIIKGAGVWAPGTTVREIEGHFSRENEPQDRVPISETG